MRLRGVIKVSGRKSLCLGMLLLFIAGVMPAFAATQTINYTYDDLYRLTQVVSDTGYSEQYTYDEVGNRLTFELSAANISLSQTPFDPGSTNVGASVTQRYTVTNSGTMNLVITSMNVSGPDAGLFSQTNDCSTLLPSGTCNIDVTFLPDSAGPKNATLSISSDDPDTPVMDVALTGTGVSTLIVAVEPADGGVVTAAGIDCPGDCTETYNTSGALVQLTATPATGYRFVGWSGDTGGSNNPADLLMDVNKAVTANFSVSAYTISTSAGANGSINCSPNPVEYDSSSTCTISPNAGYSINTVIVDDIEQSSAPSSYTFNNIQAEHSLAATFADTIAPVLTVSTLSDNSWTSDGTLNISGDAVDYGSGLQGLTINGAAIVVNPDSTFSHAELLAEGTNTISVIATDNVGNTATDTRTINHDPYAPVITIDQPADNSKTNNQTVAVSGYVDDFSAVTGITNNLLAVPFSFNEEDGTFSSSASLTYGTNTIEVEASDLALNTATAKRTVTYDNLAPSLSVTQPPHDITTSQTSMDVQGSVSDLTITTVTMTVDGGAPETLAVTDGQFTKTVIFTVTKTYVIQVTAMDEAGNSTSVTRNIVYLQDDTIPNAFTFSAQTGVALNTVVLSNTITVSGINAPAPIFITGGTYSINGGAYTSAAGTVNNGNTVTVRQTSAGSYSTTTSATLTIGGVGGTFSVTTLARPNPVANGAMSPLSGTTATVFSLTDSSTPTDSTVKVYVNWGDGSPIVGPYGTGHIFTHVYTSIGNYTVTQTARDEVGFTSTKTYTLSVSGGATGKGTLLISASGSVSFNISYKVMYGSTTVSTGTIAVGGSKSILLDSKTYSVKFTYQAKTPLTDPLTYHSCSTLPAGAVTSGNGSTVTVSNATVDAGDTVLLSLTNCNN